MSRSTILFVAFFALAAVCYALPEPNSALGRGFGDKYDWYTMEDGLAVAKETSKPIMLVIHKSWCGACKALGPNFAEEEELQEFSKNFVMINVQDDDEPSGEQYRPDGGYIPRILFMNPEGEVQTELTNPARSGQKYLYFYPSGAEVVVGAKEALKAFSGDASDAADEANAEL